MASLLFFLLPFFSAFATAANAFTFSFGTPSQCDNLALTWSGGTAPFQLLMIPIFSAPQNISIPSSAYNNGQGSYEFQLPLAQNTSFLLTMSDATGFNAGGTSNVLTVQASTSGSSCNTTIPSIAFSFEANTALQQCRPFTFSGYDGAIQPVTMTAIVPGGSIFSMTPAVGTSSFDWTADVVHGTSMVFMMFDAQGRTGGSSDITIVSTSDDATCLDSQSPSSTANPPSAPSTSASSSSTAAPTQSSTSPASQGGFSIAAIAGTVIGSLLFLAVVITLGLFFLRKRRDGAQPSGGHAFGGRHSRAYGSDALNLNYDPSQPSGVPPYGMQPPYGQGPNAYQNSHYAGSNAALAAGAVNPFLDSPPASQYQPSVVRLQPPGSHYEASTYNSSLYQSPEVDQYETSHQQYQHPGAYQHSLQSYPPSPHYLPRNPAPPADPFNTFAPPMVPGEHDFDPLNPQQSSSNSGDSMSAAQRKAAAAGVSKQPPSRFILHTDVEDDLPPPNADGVVELPPQYSERRGPLAVSNPNPLPSPGLYAGHPPGATYSQRP